MLFAEGGRAWAKTTQIGSTFVNATGAVTATFDGNSNQTGWVAGAGSVFSLNRNWTLDFGYKFVDFGSEFVPVKRTHMPSGVSDVNRQHESLDLHLVNAWIEL